MRKPETPKSAVAKARAAAPILGAKGVKVTPIPKLPIAAIPARTPKIIFVVLPAVSRKVGIGKVSAGGGIVEEVEDEMGLLIKHRIIQ